MAFKSRSSSKLPLSADMIMELVDEFPSDDSDSDFYDYGSDVDDNSSGIDYIPLTPLKPTSSSHNFSFTFSLHYKVHQMQLQLLLPPRLTTEPD